MTSITNDYTRKIQFAESWLQKAKVEFEQGSELTASSHIILAIAEMEALKHSLFPESNPVQLPYRKQRYVRFDIRPIFALALLALALGIFSYSFNAENNQVTDRNLNYVASSENSTSVESPGLVYQHPAFESVIEKLDLMINNNAAQSLGSVEDNQPTAYKNPSPANKPGPRAGNISPVNAEKSPAIASDPVMPSRNEVNVASAVHEIVFKFIPEEIQLETIIAARESLNLDE